MKKQTIALNKKLMLHKLDIGPLSTADQGTVVGGQPVSVYPPCQPRTFNVACQSATCPSQFICPTRIAVQCLETLIMPECIPVTIPPSAMPH